MIRRINHSSSFSSPFPILRRSSSLPPPSIKPILPHPPAAFRLSAYGGLSFFKWGSRRYLHRYRHPVPEYPTAQCESFKHCSENREAERRNKLTANTFGGAIGLWRRRRVQIWLEKLGAIDPFPGNFATRYSKIKKEEALDRYKKLFPENPVSPLDLGFHVHPEDIWLGASPYRDVKFLLNPYELSSTGVLEIKCPSPRISHETFPRDQKTRPEEVNLPWKRIPPFYMPQVQGLMEIMDREWMDYYVWTPSGSSLFRLHRDDKYWALLKEALSDFWWNNVVPAKKICERYEITNPLVQLSSLKPEAEHELCRSIVYYNKCLVDDSEFLHRDVDGKLKFD